ncbi:SDR family oxidoreductase [Oleispirillum naphthae]|uniref:SDR family oxidoreductase n=1 Tax=Oleispirillum naphthae TaxID=2838853 RepID=UPI00308220BA
MRKLSELLDLSGRVALVTGGAGHIGLAICEALAEQGCALAVLDRAVPETLCADLAGRFGARAEAVVVDLADEAAARGAVADVVERFGRLDILVNNAAFVGTSALQGWATPFAEQSAETWRSALEVNLTAAFVLCQAAAPALSASGHGSIVNLGSIYGVVGPDWRLYEGTAMGNPAAYAASKGGLIQFTRWLSTTLAPAVRVNAVSPGGVARGQAVEFLARYEARAPLGRMAVEEDFKGVVALLASDAAAYITGQNILVDGGWSVW